MTEIVGTNRGNAREIRVDGMPWLVYEHTPDLDRRSSPTLVFECSDAVRRVRDFPPAWRTLGDSDLADISLRR